jgi:hypothetical protein
MSEIYISIHEHELLILEVSTVAKPALSYIGHKECYDVDPLPVGVTAMLNVMERKYGKT